MLLDLLLDTRIAAVLTAILGVLCTHLVWLRKWYLEKQHHATELADERARQDRLRFLNDLSKDYANLMFAINEMHLHTHTNKMKSDSAEIHRKDALKALININNVAPKPIVEVANGSWQIATFIFNHDQKYPPDFLEAALGAYLSDFHALAKLHLGGSETVALEPEASQVKFVQTTFEEFLEELPKAFEKFDYDLLDESSGPPTQKKP